MALIKNANSKFMARDAVVLDLGDLVAQGERIKRETLNAAEKMISEARAERERILAGAREEGVLEGHTFGHKYGLEQGEKKGREEAFAKASAMLADLQAKWLAALELFEKQRDELLADARAGVLGLAAESARRVTKKAVEMQEKPALAQLEAALKLVLAPTRLVIDLNPDDVADARAALPLLLEKLGLGAHAEVAAIPGLARGSVIVRTERGVIDASIDTQLDRIVAALLGGEPETPLAAAKPEPDASSAPTAAPPVDS